jgi:hypothetical protein
MLIYQSQNALTFKKKIRLVNSPQQLFPQSQIYLFCSLAQLNKFFLNKKQVSHSEFFSLGFTRKNFFVTINLFPIILFVKILFVKILFVKILFVKILFVKILFVKILFVKISFQKISFQKTGPQKINLFHDLKQKMKNFLFLSKFHHLSFQMFFRQNMREIRV